MRGTATVLLVLALATGPAAASAVERDTTGAHGGGEERRAFWVDAFNEGIYDQAQVDELVADALAANVNTLFVQVGRRFDCFCDDALYPRTDAGIAPGFDPLAAVVEAGHAAGLEVHAWINATTLWNSATPPTSPDHAFNRHGPSAEGRDRWLNRRVDGEELMGANAYIDPGNPDAVDYVVEGVRSVVANYDVDGVNLDYIRYPDFNTEGVFANDWGYTDVALERFHAATGRDDTPEPTDEQWADWRRDQVTNLVRRIHLATFDEDPSVALSINAVTYAFGPQTYGSWEQARPYAEVLQDWRGWMEEGIVDLNVAMNYKRNWMPDQAQMFEEWTDYLADHQYGRHAVNGPALYLNGLEDTLAQLERTSAPSPAGNTVTGWSGYSYANPDLDATDGPLEDRRAARAALTEALTAEGGAFAEPADVPEMTWRTRPTTGHLTGDVRTLLDGRRVDQIDVELRTIDGRRLRETTTDGSGRFGFVDVPPGLYQVRVDRSEVRGVHLTVAKVRAGDLAEARLRPLSLR